MFLYVLIFFLVIALYMFIHKVVMKNIMQKRLGRKVEDRELTSISAWMEAPDANQTASGPQPPKQ
jgi:hypothetical protein